MSETNSIRKERSITTFIPFILLITVMLLIVFVFHVKKEGGDYVNKKIKHSVSPTISHIAPDFTLPDIKENNVTLSELRGKVVFLNFWATWCVVCREDLPSMERLYQRFKDDDFEMLTINIDKSGRSGVESYMKELGLTFPVLIDSGGKVSRMYQITGVPETFIIGKNGEIVYKAIGPVEWTKEAWLNAFSNLINK